MGVDNAIIIFKGDHPHKGPDQQFDLLLRAQVVGWRQLEALA